MMFYQENQTEELLKCPECKNRYDEPRILPCGQSICNHCIHINQLNQNDGSFNCVLCDEFHAKSTFPVNRSLMGFLKKQPSDVSCGKKVEELKQNLIDISSNKIKLENAFRNGKNQLIDHCLNIRGDIDLAAEKAIQDIQEKRDELLKKVDDYQKKTILTIQNDKEACEKFEKTIRELDQFREKWSKYLNKPIIDSTEVTKSIGIAIELKKEADLRMKQLDAFIFNYNKIFFENNSEKFAIGDIKFEKMTRCSQIDSLILSDQQEASLLSLIGFESRKFDLLWRGSRDGFGANKFHSLCDNKGATLTVIKSTTGYIFGGYTSVSWTSCGGYKPDNKAFLFTLTNPSKMPLKLMNKGDQYSVDDHSNYGPTFGESDLYVTSNSNSNATCYCYSGHSYAAPNGQTNENGGKFIHGGGLGSSIDKFKTIEVEVYLVF